MQVWAILCRGTHKTLRHTLGKWGTIGAIYAHTTCAGTSERRIKGFNVKDRRQNVLCRSL
jgi:hypothetical protein